MSQLEITLFFFFCEMPCWSLWCCFQPTSHFKSLPFRQGGLILHIEALLSGILENRCNFRCVNIVLSYIMCGDSLCFRRLRMCCWLTHCAPGGPVVWQILYSCSYKQAALFNSSLQSLGEEIGPPEPLPTTDKEVNYSIGFTDLNGDLTFCFFNACGNTTQNWVLHFYTVTTIIQLCKNRVYCKL